MKVILSGLERGVKKRGSFAPSQQYLPLSNRREIA